MTRLKHNLLRWCRRLLMAVVWIVIVVMVLWSAGAIGHLTYLPGFLRAPLAVAYFAGMSVLFVRVTSKRRWLAVAAASVAGVYLLSLGQRPSNNRDWETEQLLIPNIVLNGDEVRIGNFRQNVYRSETDFDVLTRSESFRLSQLSRVYFIVQRFTAMEGLAHTFLSFEYLAEDGPHYFSVSVEIRREAGEVYSPIRGLYRQYELMYVIGDERDLIGQRTVMRPNDRVCMYPVNAKPEDVQRLFLSIAARIQRLETHPEFYHTLLNNCTNGIVFHTYRLTPDPINWLDPRIMLPGYSDRFAFAERLIGSDGDSFEELARACRIDQRAREAGITDDFSEEIRKP